jgi:hypothetical protein
MNLGTRYRGYDIDSVSISMRDLNSGTSSTLKLLVNNEIQDAVYDATDYVTLYPRYSPALSDANMKLSLKVEGKVYINSIEVRLRRSDYQGEWGQMRLPVGIDQTMYDYDTLNLADFMDLGQYRGSRLIAIEVSADAYYAHANLQLVVDGYVDGQATVIGTGKTVMIFPRQGLVIGDNANSLVLTTSGGAVVSINDVTLRLSQY